MDPQILALGLVILVFSVILHEVMHGLIALKFGDTTAQRAGRLTLNPLPHIDIIGTILVPLLSFFSGAPLIAWAKPVPVNPLNFRNIKKGELFVSAAGILANLGLAVFCALIFRILDILPITFPALLGSLLRYAIHINLLLAIFNLLPIPPLDGSKILLSQLPYRLAKEYIKLERFGFLILMFFIFIFPGPIFLLINVFVGLFSKLLLGF